MVANKDINWIFEMIQGRYKDTKGVEKSVLGDVLRLFGEAPEIPTVLHLRDDISDEQLTDLLKEASRNAIILPGGSSEPSIEAHGYWFIIEYEYFHCSVCGGSYFNDADSTAEAESFLENGDYYRYCPHCGARMDLKEEDHD